MTEQHQATSDEKGYVLDVSLDLRSIADKHTDDRVKVVAEAADHRVVSTEISVGELEAGPVRLRFDEHPGAVRVAVGPVEAEDRHILDGDTVRTTVPSSMWSDLTKINIKPLVVGPWYWGWWKQWCRTITVEGRLVCPDGRPVPGATVCGYDIDWWFIWSSKQQVGCATTAADGTFTLKFTWCCGRYPWWWWFQMRPWTLDDTLSDLVRRRLGSDVTLPLGPPTGQPSLSVFERLLSDHGKGLIGERGRLLAELDPEQLETARTVLVKTLPEAPELENLQVWPWAPWNPWRDCAPDLVFTASQDCGRGPVTVLDEGPSSTRWDIPDQLQVTLVASDLACCRPDDHGDDCLIVDQVCSHGMQLVAGNLAAPATPTEVAGYLVTTTDGVDQMLDAPFGGSVPVYQNPSDLLGVDYYALEHSVDDGLTWLPLPAGVAAGFSRTWMLFPGPSTGSASFATIPVGAYEVYQTRRSFQDTTFGDWDPVGDRFWLSTNYDLVSPLDTTKLADGVHRFRVVEFTQTTPGEFSGPTPVLGCDGQNPAGFVLAIDNRVISPIGHDPAHHCGAGVHTCTAEPDTHILSVRVGGVEVGPCDTIALSDGAVEIDFLAHDPDGHLGSISLTSHYGVSGLVDLTAAGTVVSLDGGPDATTYAAALAGGAVRPTWAGGPFRLTVPAAVAFPTPCCYLLRLESYKRTITNCVQNIRNVSEMTLGIGV